MDLNYFSQFNNTDIYLPFFILLVLLNLGLIIFIMFHLHYGYKKHKELKKSIRDTEIMISRGFAVLHHDIAEQLKSLHKKKASGLLPPLEQEKEMEEPEAKQG